MNPSLIPKRARTTKLILGGSFGAIYKGTEFEVTRVTEVGFSFCEGLPITQLFNDEYALVQLGPHSHNPGISEEARMKSHIAKSIRQV